MKEQKFIVRRTESSVSEGQFRTTLTGSTVLCVREVFGGDVLEVVVRPGMTTRQRRAQVLEPWVGYRSDCDEMKRLLDSLESIDKELEEK